MKRFDRPYLEALSGGSSVTDDDTSDGFRVSLSGATIDELVQLECSRHDRGSLRIRSGSAIGWMCFSDGQIVHAEAGELVGEPAFFEIVRWKSGEVDHVDRTWTGLASIDASWQSLLLRAAQFEDERSHAPSASLPAGILTSTPAESGLHATQTIRPVPPPVPSERMTPAPSIPAIPPPPPPLSPPTDAANAVRLDAHGETQATLGDGADLAPLAAYVRQVAAHIGERLGFEAFAGLDAQSGGKRIAIRATSDGLVAAEAAEERAARAALASLGGAR